MRLDTDWMNAVRAERERGEEDRARWRPSHCRLGVITAHHTTVKGEQRTLKSYLTSKGFHLLFPKVDVLPLRWSISLFTIQRVGSPAGINGVKFEHILLKLKQASRAWYCSQALMWPAGPRTQYYLVFLLTVQTINNHWEYSLHQSQGWPGQSF